MAGPITIAVDSDVRGLVAGVGTANNELSGLGRVARGVGRIVATGLLAAGVGVAAFAAVSVKAGSDAQQSIGATETVYGRFADTVVRRSNHAAEAVGLAANEYRELNNVLGAGLQSAGTPLREVADLTGKLTKRASDLAATYGGTTREAIESVSSLLRGEADPIERYGISIKQSDVNARLAAQGLDKLTGSALKQAEQQARLDLLFQQSARSAGAFRKEGDTLAHQQQVLGANVDNLQAKVGTALLPVLTDVTQYLNREVAPIVLDLADEYLPKLTDAFGDPGAKAKGLGNALKSVDWSSIGATVGDLGDSFGTLAKGLAGVSLETVNDTVSVFGEVIGFAADHVDLLADALPFLVAGLVLYKGAMVANTLVGRDSLLGFALQIGSTRALVLANRELAASLVAVNSASAGTVGGIGAATKSVGKLAGMAKLGAGAAGIAGLTASAKTSNTALGVLGSTASGALLGFSVGGPIGAAIGGGAGALLGLWQATKKNTEATPAAKAKAEEYAAAIDGIAAASGRARRAEILRLLQTEGDVIPAAHQLGIDTNVLVAALDGNDRAVRKITGSWKQHQGVTDALNLETITSFLTDQGWALRQSEGRLKDNREALKKWDGKLRETGDQVPKTNTALGKLGNVKPDNKWAQLYSGDLDSSIRLTRDKTGEIGTGIANASAKWRVNTGPLQSDLTSDVRALGNAARIEADRVGAEVGGGFISGIGSRVTDIANAAASAIRAALAAAHNAAGGGGGGGGGTAGGHPAEAGRELGRSIVDGITTERGRARGAGAAIVGDVLEAMRDGRRGVKDLLGQLVDEAAKAYKKKSDKELTKAQRAGLLKAFRDEAAALDKLSARYRPLLANIAKASAELKRLRDERRDFAAGIAEAARGTADITQLGQLEDGTQTAGGIKAALEARLDAIRNFNAKVKALIGLGLKGAALEQLVNAGVDAGTVTAEALLSGGRNAVTDVVALQSEIASAAGALGETAASKLYDAGIAAQEALLDGLEADKARLDAAAGRIANQLIRTIRKRLGLDLGNKAGHNREVLGNDLATSGRRARLDEDAAGGAIRVQVTLTADQLSALERGRRAQVDLDAFRSAGGRGRTF